MEDLWVASQDEAFPEVLLFHTASVEAARTFFAARSPGTPAVADDATTFYGAFGLRRGRLGQILGARSIAGALRALTRGHFVGLPAGNPWLMPGAFLVQDRRILREHRARHAGDHPDLALFTERRSTTGERTA